MDRPGPGALPLLHRENCDGAEWKKRVREQDAPLTGRDLRRSHARRGLWYPRIRSWSWSPPPSRSSRAKRCHGKRRQRFNVMARVISAFFSLVPVPSGANLVCTHARLVTHRDRYHLHGRRDGTGRDGMHVCVRIWFRVPTAHDKIALYYVCPSCFV
jgi:hypothetical protein